MAFDLEALRLDVPEEDLSKEDGVSRFWQVLAGVLFLGLLVLGWLHFFVAPSQNKGIGVVVRTHAVSFASVQGQNAFTAGGWVEPQFPYPVKVSAQSGGRLEKILVVEGAEVKVGDVVALLNTREFEEVLLAAQSRSEAARSVLAEAAARQDRASTGARPEQLELARATKARAETKLARMQAGSREEEIAASMARVQEAETLEANLDKVAQRSQALFEKGAISREEAERDQTSLLAAQKRTLAAREEFKRIKVGYRDVELAEARAELEEAAQQVKLLEAGTRLEEVAEAKAALRAAEANVKVAESDVSLAKLRLSYCSVTSPFAGRVLEILAVQGGMIEPGQSAVLTLYDPKLMQVRVDVRQEQAASLKLGQNCSVKIEARKGKPYKGEVIRIDPQANLARDTVRAKVRIRVPDDVLRKDMTATVDFQETQSEAKPDDQPLMLPRAAVFKRDGKDFCFVIRGGLAKLVQVVLGEAVEGGFSVKSGVVSGDLVAVTNVAMLEDGGVVQIETEAEK